MISQGLRFQPSIQKIYVAAVEPRCSRLHKFAKAKKRLLDVRHYDGVSSVARVSILALAFYIIRSLFQFFRDQGLDYIIMIDGKASTSTS